MSCTRLDLDDPVPPMMPTTDPEGMSRLMSSSTGFSELREYRKVTWSKVMEPSGTCSMGWSGLVTVLRSCNT